MKVQEVSDYEKLRNEAGRGGQKPRGPITWGVWGIVITTFITISPNSLLGLFLKTDKNPKRIVLS